MDKIGNFSPLKKKVKNKHYSMKQFINMRNKIDIDNYKSVDSGITQINPKSPLTTYSSHKLCSSYVFLSSKNFSNNKINESDEQSFISKVKKNSIKIAKLTENINEYEINHENSNESEYDDSDSEEFIENNSNKKYNDELSKSISNGSTLEIINNDFYKNEENSLKNQSSILEDHIKSYYMSSKDNIPGYYDLYVTNCLKLISYFHPIEYFNDSILKLKKIHSFNFDITKKLIILDLDETLIHSDLECKYICHDYYLETESGVIPINFRPYLDVFLNFCIQHFEIIIYTASCKEYADPILNIIEKDKKYFKYRLYREDCISYYNFFFKDLSIFDRKENDLVIIDNCLFSFSYYLTNGILITSYYNDNEDSDLLSITEFLEKNIVNSNEVTKIIEETFNFISIKNELSKINI